MALPFGSNMQQCGKVQKLFIGKPHTHPVPMTVTHRAKMVFWSIVHWYTFSRAHTMGRIGLKMYVCIFLQQINLCRQKSCFDHAQHADK